MTTTTSTTVAVRAVPAHLVAVVSDGFEFLAVCSCGWASDWHADTEGAAAAGVEHREVAVGPPDAMDRLMSGLLDLQDDLGAVVVWLAENWSADLPSLGWYANGSDDRDLPALWVIGACAPAELVSAAAVLGSALCDDPPGGEGRIRYRRAARVIGWVRIEVFAPLDRCEAAEAAR